MGQGYVFTCAGGIPACLAAGLKGGGIPACLAGFQAHSQGGSCVVWPGGGGSPGQAHFKGQLRGLAGGSPHPHLGGSPGPNLRGLQAHTWAGSPGPHLGESPGPHPGGGVYPSMHRPPWWLLLRAVRILLECILVLTSKHLTFLQFYLNKCVQSCQIWQNEVQDEKLNCGIFTRRLFFSMNRCDILAGAFLLISTQLILHHNYSSAKMKVLKRMTIIKL